MSDDGVPVEGRVDGVWKVLWPTQAEMVAALHDRVARSATVCPVVCRRCGGVLAELLDPLDEHDNHLPLMIAVYLIISPGDEVPVVPGVRITTGKIGPSGRTGRQVSSMVVPAYGVIDPGLEAVTVDLRCSHHGDRGSVTVGSLLAHGRTGRTLRK